ncbi:MAG: hypothetical protein ACXWJ6_05460 [Xanthobacteraceae bacterium]
MFDNFIKGIFRDIFKMAGWVAAIAIAALVALSFFSFAAFVWAQEAYGTVIASLGVGAFYCFVAMATLAAMILVRRRAAMRTPPKSNLHWWSDPAVIATGVELMRSAQIKRLVPIIALGLAVIATLQPRSNSTKR